MAVCQKSNKLIKMATYCNEISQLHTKKNTKYWNTIVNKRKNVVQTAECIRNNHERKNVSHHDAVAQQRNAIILLAAIQLKWTINCKAIHLQWRI